MTEPVTLRDVADRAGVHVATASRALNPAARSRLSEATVRRVRKAAEELDYRPNAMARGLKTSRSMSVGLLVPDLTNPLFPPITRGVEDVLAGAGYTTLIANTDNDAARQSRQLAALRARQVDGLILATAHRDDPELADLADQAPLVLINRRVEGLPVPAVIADDQSGIAAAVRHLVDLGHRRVAHVAGPQHTTTGHSRSRAFRQAMEDAGLPPAPELIAEADAFTEAAGARAFRLLLDGLPDDGGGCTAVVAANDMIALGCLDVADERRLRCPRDLSVVGFNDMPFVDRLTPALTTVHVPHYEIGAEAARMLLERLADPGLPRKSVTLPVSLVVRGSTAAAKTARRTR
ncbi:LacI family transcriptional regulator [Actinomadura sp. KC216]|uniref:LacI family DNA-binding transcriptional regulator n=1 Tax=Actinomadura sp. KC216 TaxID=2530370 RepID=UPI00104C12DF|nr:LacI family DNA-binding transcriptional regulator [Actinomadura sp. KC216]TDB87909.1 LacI family transcriptional regulator [Actinomadura sp. KC216]